MADWYIDTSLASSGVGTEADPFNDWSDVTWTEFDRYYGKGGETQVVTSNLNPTVNNITLGSYGTGRHIIDGSGITASTKTIRIAGTGVTIENLHVKSPVTSSGGDSLHCIQCIEASGDYTMTNCKLEGQHDHPTKYGAGLSYLGDWPVVLDDNEVTNCNIGFQIQTDDAPDGSTFSYIRRNHIHSFVGPIDLTQDGNSDGIFIGTTSVAARNHAYTLIVEYNTLEDFKENAIDFVGVARGIAQYNIMRNPQASNNTGTGGMTMGTSGNANVLNICRYNQIYNMYTDGIVTGNGVIIRGAILSVIHSNFFYNNDRHVSNFSDPIVDASAVVLNNVFVTDRGKGTMRIGDGGGTIPFRNNIVLDTTYAIQVDGDAVVNYGNNYLGDATINASGGGGSGGGTANDLGSNVTTVYTANQIFGQSDWPTSIDEASQIETSPLLGAGVVWWAVGAARPAGYNGEPFADRDMDIGINQTTFGTFHPNNL